MNLQHQLANKIALQVGYVGSQGHRLFRFRDINQPNQATITASDLASGISSYGVPRPFTYAPPYDTFYVMQEESTAKSNYNALQTSLRVNQWRGVTSIVNYTWSHSQDTASDLEDFEPNAAQPYDSTRAVYRITLKDEEEPATAFVQDGRQKVVRQKGSTTKRFG